MKKLILTPNAEYIINERLLLRDETGRIIETSEKMMERVARSIANAETASVRAEIQGQFLDIMMSLDFLPASPVLMNAGTKLGQLAACFVLPIEDSIDKIFDTIKQSALIQASGGGVGYDFSEVRPSNDIVRLTRGVAAGPVPYLNIFNESTQTIKQSGRRRGANMGILRIDHPDIKQFINAKNNRGDLLNFNLSVAITDSFMDAVKNEKEYKLINPRNGEVVKTLNAKIVFGEIVRSAWATGEPGVFFIDTANKYNMTPHLGSYRSTNPCGETPLLPYESCVLGSINLNHMIVDRMVDWNKLNQTINLGVRFLDNVIDVNRYPLAIIKEKTLASRKIGLGVMGWADALIKLGIPYNSSDAISAAEEMMEFISFHAKRASIQLAIEKGRFPAYEGSKYQNDSRIVIPNNINHNNILKGKPEINWPELISELVKYGIRNATVTTIAPTGSIRIIADTSGGIEPILKLSGKQKMHNEEKYFFHTLLQETLNTTAIQDSDLKKIQMQGNLKGIDSIPTHIRQLFITASEVEPIWHIKMQAAFQKYVDNAVSKTVNLDNSSTEDDVRNVFFLAHNLGCKGVTVYRDGSRDEQVVTEAIAEEVVARPIPIPNETLPVWRKSIETDRGKMTIFVSEYNDKPFDIFIVIGRAGTDITSYTEAIGRLLSIGIRSGIPIDILAENLIGLGGRAKEGIGTTKKRTVPDAIGHALWEKYCSTIGIYSGGDFCPACNNLTLEASEGCLTCTVCGYNECS